MRIGIVSVSLFVVFTVACTQESKDQGPTPPVVPESPSIEAGCPTGGAGSSYVVQVSPEKADLQGAFRVDYVLADGTKGFWGANFDNKPRAKPIEGLVHIESISLSSTQNEIRAMRSVPIEGGYGCEIVVDRP